MINKLISTFKNRLEQNTGKLEVQLLGGEVIMMASRFNSPASQEMIEKLKNQFSSEFPSDYIEFLGICNGAVLFIHPQYGSENVLYCIEDVIRYNMETHQEEKVVIACINDDRIVIDLEKWRKGESNYLLLCESMNSLNEARDLYCNFETWFERFIVAQGSKYWYWKVETE